MMAHGRMRLGRFGIGQRLASAAAIAVLAVSPAIASFTDAQLDGVALAIVEAIFGTPASAQECTDINGDTRVCTVSEEGARCMAAARDSAQQCLDAASWWQSPFCYLTLVVDSGACTIDYIGDIVLPIG